MAGTGAGTSWASDNILSLSLSLGSLSCCSLGVSGRHDLPSLDDDAEDFSHPLQAEQMKVLVFDGCRKDGGRATRGPGRGRDPAGKEKMSST